MQVADGKCGQCEFIKSNIGKIATKWELNRGSNPYKLWFGEVDKYCYVDHDCVEEVPVVACSVDNPPIVGKKYKVIKKCEWPAPGFHSYENLVGQIGECGTVYKSLTAPAWNEAKLEFSSGTHAIQWDCLELVETPVVTPSGFQVGKWYKIAPNWARAGEVFKCVKVYDNGHGADLEGRPMPEKEHSRWWAIEGEVPAPLPPISADAPIATSWTKLSSDRERKALAEDNILLRAKLVNAEAAKNKVELRVLDLEKLIKDQALKYAQEIGELNKTSDKVVASKNTEIDICINERDNARMEYTKVLNENAVMEKAYREECGQNRKLVEERNKAQKEAEEAADNLLLTRVEKEKLAEELRNTKAALKEVDEALRNTKAALKDKHDALELSNKHYSVALENLAQARQAVDEVENSKWLVLQRHELALLVTDRVTSSFAQIMAALCTKHMAAMGAVGIVGLVSMLSWFAYLGKLPYGS